MRSIRIDRQNQSLLAGLSAPFQPNSGRFGGLQVHSCLHSHQTASRHPQIGQRKQRVQLRSVLLQSAIAHLDVTELALDHPERMLDLGPDTGLDAFQLIDEVVETRLVLSNCLRLPGRIAMFQHTSALASGRLATPW